MKLGFVGIGNLGYPLCSRLIEHGHQVAAFDLDDAALARVVARGAEGATSSATAAAGAEIVLTCLPSPAATSDAIAGPDGVLAGATPGAILVDLSTNDPEVVRALAERAEAAGLHMIDSPVAGGLPKAFDGTLTLMVGGAEQDVERARPVLGCLGSHIFHLGPVGSGSVVKIANNVLAFCNLAAASEAFLAVARLGISPERFLDVLDVSSGGSVILERFHRKVLPGDFSAEFTLRLAYKDVGLGLKLGDESGVPMVFATAVGTLMQQAIARGYGEEDCCAMIRALEDVVGAPLRRPRP